MRETTRIDTQEAFSRFLRVVDGFHDSLLHEIVILHPGCVRANGSMAGDGQLPNARLIFQSQFGDIAAVQLDLKRVSTFGFNFTRKLKWQAEFGPSQVRIYQAGHGDSESCEIRAAEVEYKLLGKETRGPHYCMVREELLSDDLFYNET